MIGKTDIKKYSIWLGLSIAILISIGFVDKKQEAKICNTIVVNIDDQNGNYFITEDDIINILTKNGEQFILGTPFEELNIKSLEKQVNQHKFIHKADVFRDLKGNLVVNAQQCKPIARLLISKGEDKYISNFGEILPVSKRFTARVPIISGFWPNHLSSNSMDSIELGKDILDLLQFIDSNEFWKAQIAQINIDKKGNTEFIQQVGKQVIEFGKPSELEKKFEKLKIFYDQILPRKGWNHYDRVNLAYQDKIICK